MNHEELEAQFAELDSLCVAHPNDVDMSLDGDGTSIIVTRNRFDYDIDISGDTNCGPGWTQGRNDFEAYGETATLPISGSYEAVRISGQMRSPFQSSEQVMRIDLSNVEISDEVVYKRMTLVRNPDSVNRLPDVKLMGLGVTGIYEVVEDYSYPVDYSSIGRKMPSEVREQYRSNPEAVPHLCTITVKKGFQFDRATIPRIFWIFVSKDDLSNVAPLFHDLMYRFSGVLPRGWVEPYTRFSREEADHLFFHTMKTSGVTSWRLHIAYQAVCHFSSFAWDRNKDIY